MTEIPPDGAMRIGELAARTGVSAHALRAWERRYGLLRPVRSHCGYRLYGASDEARVRFVLAQQAEGVAAGEAAARALAAVRAQPRTAEHSDGESVGLDATGYVDRLDAAVHALDERAAGAVLDELFAELPFAQALIEVLVPYLRTLGEQWAASEITVAHEHFASSLLHRRLAMLTQRWSATGGPTALLAAAPSEYHDLMLLAFGVLLGQAGWRVHYLGVNLPSRDLAVAADQLAPDLVVVAGREAARFADPRGELAAIAAAHRVALAGPGVTPELCATIGVLHLAGDPVQAADRANASVRAAGRTAAASG